MFSFKLGTLQLVLPVLLGSLTATALLYVGLAFTSDPMGIGELRQLLLTAVVAGAVVALAYRGHGVSLTEEALVFQGDRRRRIPRTDIIRLEVRRTLGVSRVAVHTVDGRHTMLRAPMSFMDREFDRKAQILSEWSQGGR
ncbi:hypothetical protein [Streptomyces shenzhenensis]|uniref:hypothetical protein n=1 Tax=Streptomyces shenzhenensis TaxID=943815 RepID=UPI0015F02F24|nr:hypothetical protein [Streptomyces shenzhenensis]